MSIDAVVVALGNPGNRYLKTRHNAGFMLADLFVHESGGSFSLKKNLEAECAEVSVGSRRVFCLKPQTYMNLSGRSLVALYKKNKDLKDLPLIVLHDEADLAFGRIKIKEGGGDAGHNGLKSIRECLGHGNSVRIRLGVGRPQHAGQDVASYLLEPFRKDEENQAIDLIVSGLKVLDAYLEKGLSHAQEVAGEESRNGS